MTVQTHPDLPIAFAELTVPTNLSSNSTSDILRTHMAYVTPFAEQGLYVNMQYFAPAFDVPLMVWYNHTQEELDQITAPYLAALKNITDYTYNSREYGSFLEMYKERDGVQNAPIAVYLFGGRLLPQSLFQFNDTLGSNGKLQDVLDYYIAQSISFFYVAFQLPGVIDRDRNAITDAWRESNGLLIPVVCVLISCRGLDRFVSNLVNFHSALENEDTEEMYSLKRKEMTEVVNQPLVEITDGAYSNEVCSF